MDQSDARLEMSVSFGRFENDALSWEKWSSFSPNKYLEEVGSLSTPGSVAQKKAYFEAHYKKIAAQKAEALEQEKAMSQNVPDLDVSSDEASVENSCEIYHGSGSSNGAKLIEHKFEEFCFSISPHESSNREILDDSEATSSGVFEPGSCHTALMDTVTCDDEPLNDVIAVNDGSSVVEEAPDDLNGFAHLSMTDDESNTIDFHPKCSPGTAALGRPVPVEVVDSNPNDAGNVAPKITRTKERSLSSSKKKVASPVIKQTPTSMNSRRRPISTPTSAAQSLKQKNGTPQLQNKNHPVVDYKRRLVPTSLHMSLNTGSAVSLGDPSSMMRKSSIMEKLGDKDIVRRAFKSFQKRDFACSLSQNPSPLKNESPAAIKPKISVPRTPVKVNGRLSASTQNPEKRVTPRYPSGARSNPLPSGSRKMLTPDKKYATGSSPHTLTKDERAEKRKEFIKKLEANSIARAAENAHRSTTSKPSC